MVGRGVGLGRPKPLVGALGSVGLFGLLAVPPAKLYARVARKRARPRVCEADAQAETQRRVRAVRADVVASRPASPAPHRLEGAKPFAPPYPSVGNVLRARCACEAACS